MNNPTTLAQIVHRRAATHPDAIAYTFLADGDADARSLTWSDLDRRARTLASSLIQQNASAQPVLLTLPSGLAFVESLLACWYAGAIAVPVSLPRHQRVKHRLHRIINDAGARFAIAPPDTRQRLEADPTAAPLPTNFTWINPEPAPNTHPIPFTPFPADQTALLQYTSGSTGDPRGVVITHKNLLHNSSLIAESCDHNPAETIGGWLPLFHDMGLIGLIIQAAFSGARCVFMAPERFLMRPFLWLKMISDYRIASSPAPNFAYDLCSEKITPEQKASLDLTHWRTAFNGSEPVRPASLERFATTFASTGFRPDTFFPCYGLAESTLFVTGPGKNRTLTRRASTGDLLAPSDPGGHIACGQPFGDTQLAIIDPATLRPLPSGQIGEIWLAGDSCAKAYWNNPAATAATFHASLPASNLPWLRTGDLGFLADNQLFITGRLRELIIIAGRNLFPVDLERSVESADPAIAPSAAAAFSIDLDNTERLVIAAEIRRHLLKPARHTTPLDLPAIRRHIRAAIVADHDVAPHAILLLRPGALPRTTSGKLSRRQTLDGYLQNTLDKLEEAAYVHPVT